MRRHFRTPLALALFLLTSPALAADGGDLQRFHPAPVPAGGLGAGVGETLDPGDWSAALTFNYAKNPLIRWDDGERMASTVAHNLTTHVTGAFGVFHWLTLEAAAPFVVYQAGNEPGFELAGQALGDLRVSPRFRLLTQWKHGLALSFAPTVTIPLGGAPALAGDPSAGLMPEVALSYRGAGVTFASQLAVRVRKDVAVVEGTRLGTEATLRLAAAFEVSPRVEALVDFNAGLAFSTVSDGLVGNPLEALVGARIRPDPRWAVTVGAGTALLSAPGTPDVRLVASVAYGSGNTPVGVQACIRTDVTGSERRRAHGVDSDEDTIDDACDLCPASPETRNGLLDEDGCPDSDRDGDAVLDAADQCPDEKGVAPTGCPDSNKDDAPSHD